MVIILNSKNLFQKGHSPSIEVRQKMSLARKGKKLSHITIEKIRKNTTLYNPMKKKENREKISKTLMGHTVSKITKDKIRESLRGRFVGNKNPSWKGGITSENTLQRGSIEYRLWRESIYARDHWTCQMCNDSSGGNLVSHHLKNFSQHIELRFAIDNGITLCSHCHNAFHKKYGNKNNNKEQLEEFLWRE